MTHASTRAGASFAWTDADRVLPADGYSLLAMVDRAVDELNRENNGAARAGIEAFIGGVQALVEADTLDAADGRPRIKAAAAMGALLQDANRSGRCPPVARKSIEMGGTTARVVLPAMLICGSPSGAQADSDARPAAVSRPQIPACFSEAPPDPEVLLPACREAWSVERMWRGCVWRDFSSSSDRGIMPQRRL